MKMIWRNINGKAPWQIEEKDMEEDLTKSSGTIVATREKGDEEQERWIFLRE